MSNFSDNFGVHCGSIVRWTNAPNAWLNGDSRTPVTDAFEVTVCASFRLSMYQYNNIFTVFFSFILR